MRIEILASARGDLIDGFHYYEQKEAGLGNYFLAALYSDIESLRIFGGIHAKAYKGRHRSLSQRFPFAIYYTLRKQYSCSEGGCGLPPQSFVDS